mmetsp:Transcript_17980/g.55001  ORF Transcript_17980/g.55001 Transcript_17980/m.55001 type:complete len:209 (-) Transcript_17980:1818-2444(-)
MQALQKACLQGRMAANAGGAGLSAVGRSSTSKQMGHSLRSSSFCRRTALSCFTSSGVSAASDMPPPGSWFSGFRIRSSRSCGMMFGSMALWRRRSIISRTAAYSLSSVPSASSFCMRVCAMPRMASYFSRSAPPSCVVTRSSVRSGSVTSGRPSLIFCVFERRQVRLEMSPRSRSCEGPSPVATPRPMRRFHHSKSANGVMRRNRTRL